MLDTHARKYVNPIIELGAKLFLNLKLIIYEIRTVFISSNFSTIYSMLP